MANTSEEKHEVFICFRGEDTRTTFTSHLNAALKRLDIRTYIDHDLRRGDEIPERLLGAIRDANLSLIVFSENFASSKWCLDEVVNILECRKSGQIVLPVFYRIDPSVVRNQTGSYDEALAKHEQRFEGSNMNKVQTWRDALKEAANISGCQCKLDSIESDLVDEIAMDVLEKLDRVNVADLDHLIDKHEKLQALQRQYGDYTASFSTRDKLKRLRLDRGIRLLRMPSEH